MSGPSLSTPPTSVVDTGTVGRQYHLLLGSVDGNYRYGYTLHKGTTFKETSDTNRKSQLTQYASPNIIDRDITNQPRVTDGDFSGGQGQVNFLDPKRYWDGTLDIRTPGYLKLRAGWTRTTSPSSSAPGATVATPPFQYGQTPFEITMGHSYSGPQLATAYWTFNENGGFYYYQEQGAAPNRLSAGGGILNVSGIQADQSGVYITDGVTIFRIDLSGTARHIFRNPYGGIQKFWVVDQGAGGYYIYYTQAPGTGYAGGLWRVDLSLWNGVAQLPDYPDPASGQVLIPFGANLHVVQDVVPYLAGVAALVDTHDGCEVWNVDSSGTDRIVKLSSYYSYGMCNVLGTLYLTVNPKSAFGQGYLVSITGSSMEFLVPIGRTPPTFTNQVLGAPTAAGRRLYFTLQTTGTLTPPGGANTRRQVMEFDAQSGELSTLQALDLEDNPGLYPRSMIAIGDGVAFPMTKASDGTVCSLQAQSSSGLAPGGPTYSSTQDFLVSSRHDFNTPGLHKLFRRLTVYHAPLAAGEEIKLSAYVDADPTLWTAGSIATASVTHPYDAAEAGLPAAGQTELTFPINTQGRSLFFALQVKAGTSGATSPVIYYVSMEVSVAFVWDFTVYCGETITTLDEREDEQSIKGKDLRALLFNAWLTGDNLLFWHPDGTGPWTVSIENFESESISPLRQVDATHKDDVEWLVTLKLRALPS